MKQKYYIRFGKLKKIVAKDIVWYFIGMIIPILVNIIQSPVFTRIFSPEEYGYYSLVVITYSYISILLYSWISHCIWRYYNNYKKDNNLSCLYSNLFALFLFANIIMIIISFIWISSVSNHLMKKLIMLSLLQLPLNQVISISLIVDRLEGRSFKYNLIHSLQVLVGFLITYYLAAFRTYRIESILAGKILIDSIIFVCLIFSSRLFHKISYKRINIKLIKKFTTYGFVGMICSLSLVILTSSDRYIISLFEPMGAVGIYNQIYNLGQLSIATLITVYFNVINPVLYHELEFYLEQYNEFITSHIYRYIYLFLPITIYLSLFSKQLSSLLLGEKFQVGYKMIPYIITSNFIYGLALFTEAKLKFLAKYKDVISGFVVSILINIILNIIFIPLYGYFYAALTTLIAYLFLYIYYYRKSSIRYFNKPLFKEMSPFLIILITQILIDLFIRNVLKFELKNWQTIIEVTFFCCSYLLFIFMKKRELISTIYSRDNL